MFELCGLTKVIWFSIKFSRNRQEPQGGFGNQSIYYGRMLIKQLVIILNAKIALFICKSRISFKFVMIISYYIPKILHSTDWRYLFCSARCLLIQYSKYRCLYYIFLIYNTFPRCTYALRKNIVHLCWFIPRYSPYQ